MLKLHKGFKELAYIILLLLPSVSLMSQQSKVDSLKWETGQFIKNKLSVKKLMNDSATDKIADVKRLFENNTPVRISHLSVAQDYNYIHDTSGAALGSFNKLEGVLDYNATMSLSIFNMPFDIGIKGSNGLYNYNNTPFDNLSKFNFNYEKYLDDVKQQVVKNVSPDALAKATFERINAIRKKYESGLQAEIRKVETEFSNEFKSSRLSLPEGINDLSITDLSGLRTKLLSGDEQENYKMNIDRYQEILTRKGAGEGQDSLYNQALEKIKKYEALEKIYNKVLSWRQRFLENDAVKKLQANLPFSKDNVNKFLSNPDNLKKAATENFNLNSLQRLFLNITKLDIGQNPLQGGDLEFKNVMNAGINTEFKNAKANIGFVYGKSNNVNNWLQSGLQSTVTNEYSSLTGIKLGTGSQSLLEQSMSVNMFNFQKSPGDLNRPYGMQSIYGPSANYSAAIISLHTGLPLSGNNKVEIDLSKSFSSYNNNYSNENTSQKLNNFGQLFSNVGTSNYALKIDYKGIILKTDANLYIKSVGLGYNNPGNYLLRRGEKQLGWTFSRQLKNRKLTIKYAGDYRKQDFDPAKNYVYKSFSNKLQVGYKIKKNNKVSFAWQRSDYQSAFLGRPTYNGKTTRLQLDGMYKLKWGNHSIMNNTILSQQQLSMPMIDGELFKNKSLLFTHTSSMLFKQNILSVTVLANKTDNKDYYFSTSILNTEVNYTYSAGTGLRLSSSTGYYVNYGWNRQIGYTQQLSTIIFNKLSVDLQLGYKKAVKTIRPELANQLFMSSSIRYNF